MSTANILQHADVISITEAREAMVSEGLRFEHNYQETYVNYYSNQSLALSSRSFELDKLPSFNPWRDELVAQRVQYMPLIVSKMLGGDPLAHSIFKEVCRLAGKPDLVREWDDLVEDPILREAFLNSDASAGSCAIFNAQFWLNSADAHDILCMEQYHQPQTDLLLSHPC